MTIIPLSGLNSIIYATTAASPPGSGNYVSEDGNDNYVTEDGANNYVTESS